MKIKFEVDVDMEVAKDHKETSWGALTAGASCGDNDYILHLVWMAAAGHPVVSLRVVR